MGLLYKIYQSIQEMDDNSAEITDSHREKDEDESSEHSKSLIELLSQPVGRRLSEGKENEIQADRRSRNGKSR